MKIAFIGQQGIPAKFGSVEKYVEELAKRLAKSGNDVFVYAKNSYTEKSLKKYENVRIIHIPTFSIKFFEAQIYALFATIHALFANYDVIHYQATGQDLFTIIPKIFKRKTALILTAHNRDYFSYNIKNVIASFIPDKIITIYKNIKSKAIFIPSGISASPISDSRYLLKWNLQKNGYIIFSGKLIKEKGVHYLISAFKNLDDKHLTRGKKLVIVDNKAGSKEYANELKDSSRGRENIIFIDSKNEESLLELFSHTYMFVNPTEIGDISNISLEALGYGRAILSSDIKINKEMLDKEVAVFFKSADIKDLEEKLVSLINSPLEIKKMGEKALEKVAREYNWNKIVNQIESIYETELSRKSQSIFRKKNKSYAKNI